MSRHGSWRAVGALAALLLVGCSESPVEPGGNPQPPPAAPPPAAPPPTPPPAPPPPPTGLQVVVDNQLYRPIQLSIAGVPRGQQAARTAVGYPVPSAGGSTTVEWSLVRSVTGGGSPVGDPMSGSFTVTSNSGEVRLIVDNVVGDQWYFQPLISNGTATALLIMVNGGTVAENRCNCVVPGFQNDTDVGYYRLYTNSDVRGYRAGSGYVGSYAYFDNFSGLVTRGHGRLPLTFTLAP